MSSHHIVRDKQEPALLIIQPEVCDFSQIQELLEWSPVVAVLENTLDVVLDWQIKIDIIFCQNTDLESITEITQNQQPISMIASEGDLSNFALDYLHQNQHKTISLIADWQDLALLEPFLPEMEIILYAKNWKTFFVKNGYWRKWLPQNTELALLANPLKINNLQENKDSLNYIVLEDNFVEIDNAGVGFWLKERIF